jgi:hypothetical protein
VRSSILRRQILCDSPRGAYGPPGFRHSIARALYEEWVAAFAGKLGNVFGDHQDTLRYLDDLRRDWEPDDPS